MISLMGRLLMKIKAIKVDTNITTILLQRIQMTISVLIVQVLLLTLLSSQSFAKPPVCDKKPWLPPCQEGHSDNDDENKHESSGKDELKPALAFNLNSDKSIVSNLEFIRMDNQTYIMYVQKNKNQTQLVMRDLQEGNISNKANASVSSVGRDDFKLTVVDKDTSLNADEVFLFGDKGKFGIADIDGFGLSNMSKKYHVNSNEIIQPILVTPASQLGEQYWITLVMPDHIITYLSDQSGRHLLSEQWRTTISQIHTTLAYGGLLFVQHGSQMLSVLAMNSGKLIKQYSNVGEDFSIEANMDDKSLIISSNGHQQTLSELAILFMRENLKQVQ